MRTMAAVADAIIPRGGGLELGAADVDVARRVDAALGHFDTDLRRAIAWLVSAWEYHTLLTRGRRFSQLSAAQRAEVVERAYHSQALSRRLPLELLKQLSSFAYGSAPEVEAALGFDASCISREPPQRGPRLQPLRHPEIHGNLSERVDVCVIGSGAGGAVIAKELAEAGRSVLIIEEGDYFTADDFNDTPFNRVLRTYRDQGATIALGRPVIPLPLGKAVGGTTVINSGTCFRAPEHILQRWVSEFGLDGYDSASLAPLFDRVERELNVMPVPWEIIGKNAEVFDRGVRALGLRGEPIRRNIRGCRGCGVCAFGCPSDAKQAMHVSYLPRAAAAGARIFARCRADGFLWKGQRVIGVEASILDRHNDDVRGRLTVHADSVVVAAGTIHTPLLLRTAGVKDRSGQLGRNLRLHPALSVSGSFNEDIYAWRGTLQSYFVDHLALSDDVMIEVTNPIPSMAVNTLKNVGMPVKEALGGFKHRASAGLFVSDSSSGQVRRMPGRPRPLIFYSLNQQDTTRLLRGMALAAEIFFAAGAQTVHVDLPGLSTLRSSRDLPQLRDAGRWKPSALQPTAFHPMGTCRMGPDPSRSVVGLGGQVHGVGGLFVADGSLFPSCVGVNPQETIMTFATRIANGMLSRS
ncbi:MAG: GMC family oxidoreductase N-terminal domain-containing protein [Deltaproteobacteria bacterium]|nr:GMC family oxidoreductase N-terminal domain-containing protein [Deltaproteobacteria bacterium]